MRPSVRPFISFSALSFFIRRKKCPRRNGVPDGCQDHFRLAPGLRGRRHRNTKCASRHRASTGIFRGTLSRARYAIFPTSPPPLLPPAAYVAPRLRGERDTCALYRAGGGGGGEYPPLIFFAAATVEKPPPRKDPSRFFSLRSCLNIFIAFPSNTARSTTLFFLLLLRPPPSPPPLALSPTHPEISRFYAP